MSRTLATLTRVFLWFMLAVSTVGSIGFLTHPTHPKRSPPGLHESTVLQDQSVAGFAAAFAHAWLTWSVIETPEAWQSQLQPFVPSELLNSTFQEPATEGKKGQQVESVFPIRVTRLAPDKFLVDVYAQTNLHPLIDLSVPVNLDAAGHPAIVNPPIFKPVPMADSVTTTPTGAPAPDDVTTALRPVVAAFLQAYLSGHAPADLTNFVAPGTTLEPLDGLLTWSALTDLQVVGKDLYTVFATVNVEDPSAQVTMPQTYVLHMVQNGGKWFVSSLQP